jgi:small GTP-binding protein
MIQKKICLLGAFAVGKTSLVRRFVQSIFSEKYHTTVGVKIDKKVVQAEGQEVHLLVWDLHGEDDFQKVRSSYLRGAAGYLLVVDGTRRASFDTALALHDRMELELGPIPFVLVLNKSDLRPEWDLEPAEVEALASKGWTILESSAKTGHGVDEAFLSLTRSILGG